MRNHRQWLKRHTGTPCRNRGFHLFVPTIPLAEDFNGKIAAASVTAEPVEDSNVIDLMAALKKSLKPPAKKRKVG